MVIVGLVLCGSVSAQELAVSTNVVDYANFGTVNVEASYGFARHWSAVAAAKYNPFSFRDGELLSRQRLFALGARYWPWHIYSGWWVAGKAQYQEYNTGGIVSQDTSEGDRWGASLSGGFTYMLGRHFNLDFGAGLWAGYDRYVTYACPNCGRFTGSGEKFFLLPNDIIVALTYVF